LPLLIAIFAFLRHSASLLIFIFDAISFRLLSQIERRRHATPPFHAADTPPLRHADVIIFAIFIISTDYCFQRH
jgi:hypothetical protein